MSPNVWFFMFSEHLFVFSYALWFNFLINRCKPDLLCTMLEMESARPLMLGSELIQLRVGLPPPIIMVSHEVPQASNSLSGILHLSGR